MLRRIKQELRQGKTLLIFASLQAIGQALGMIAPLVAARFFSPELISSVQTPFIVFANRERAESGKIAKSFSIQCIFLIASIIAFVILNFVFSGAILRFTKIQSGDLFFMFLAFIGIAVKQFFRNLFMALGRRITNSFVELAFGTLSFTFVIVLSLAGKINLQNMFLTYFISSILVVVIFIKAIDFSLLRPFDFDWGHFKEMFKFSRWMILGLTAVYFINWGDNIVLRSYGITMANIGAYNLAYQIFNGVVSLIFILNAYFLPFVSQHVQDSSKMKEYLYSKRPKIFILGLGVMGIVFIITPVFFRVAYGGDYPGAESVLRILLIGSILILYNTFYVPVFNAMKSYKFSQTTNIIQVIINVLLNIILIPILGPYGAAVATVAAYLYKTVFYELYFRVRLKKLLIS